jgi:chemotaxis protein MotA
MTNSLIERDIEVEGGVSFLVLFSGALGLVAVISLLASGSSGNIAQFFDLPSIALVLGGTIGATLVQYSSAELQRCFGILRSSLQGPKCSPFERIQQIVELAHTAREHGLLALENAADRVNDPFFRTGLKIAADGDRMNDLRPLLENEAFRAEEKIEHAAGILGAMGSYAPAMGLIGTLLGLIKMLSGLNEPQMVGPAMSLALVSTLYGAMVANICFLPLAGKLRSRNEQESLIRRVTIEGVVGLSILESPTLLSQRLKSFVAGVSIDE